MTNKKPSHANLGDAAQQNRHNHPNTLSSQRKRLLAYLQKCEKITTDEARTKLDIMHPAGRIRELKTLGYVITCKRLTFVNKNGISHKMGVYTYNDATKEVNNA